MDPFLSFFGSNSTLRYPICHVEAKEHDFLGLHVR